MMCYYHDQKLVAYDTFRFYICIFKASEFTGQSPPLPSPDLNPWGGLLYDENSFLVIYKRSSISNT